MAKILDKKTRIFNFLLIIYGVVILYISLNKDIELIINIAGYTLNEGIILYYIPVGYVITLEILKKNTVFLKIIFLLVYLFIIGFLILINKFS
jgi:hypothetical protein